eukprot:3037391-Amphidinium_carterae.1
MTKSSSQIRVFRYCCYVVKQEVAGSGASSRCGPRWPVTQLLPGFHFLSQPCRAQLSTAVKHKRPSGHVVSSQHSCVMRAQHSSTTGAMLEILLVVAKVTTQPVQDLDAAVGFNAALGSELTVRET